VISDFENVWGSFQDDVLTGTDQATEIFGFDGDDTINGLAGDDLLVGDQLFDLNYDNGADTIDGGEGTDVCLQADDESNCESDEPPPPPARRQRSLRALERMVFDYFRMR
jgi:hypothetical protein